MRRSRSRSPVRERGRDRDRRDYGGYSRGGGGGGGGYADDDRRGRDDGNYYRSRRQRSRSRSREHDQQRGAGGGYYGSSSGHRDDERYRPVGDNDNNNNNSNSGYYAARDRLPPPPMPSSAAAAATTTTTAAPAPRPPPLSLEELVRKKQEEAAVASKPVFMTKAQREAVELERRRAEVAAAAAAAGGSGGGGGSRSKNDSDLLDRWRNNPAAASHHHPHRRQPYEQPPPRDREREAQLAAIKKHYLGDPKPEKKRVTKASERTKFVFDWDAKAEDTAAGADPLLLPTGIAARSGGGHRPSSSASAASGRDGGAGAVASQALLFGRGRLAGVDDGMMERRGKGGGGAGGGGGGGGSRGGRVGVGGVGGGERDEKSSSHWSRKPREEMTERDWRIFREDFNIAYKGAGWLGGGASTNAANASSAAAAAAAANAVSTSTPTALAPSLLPIRNWQEASLPDPLVRAVQAAGYEKPSPIQMASIPLGLAQRDVIGIAETGSGKTAAFALPMLSYCLRQPPMAGDERVASDGPYALVMAPTRELAQQIEEETRKLARFTPFRVVAVVGGQPIEEQGVKLRRGAEVVVATPGRLADCLERAFAVLNQCHYVVLDEADRMIDMGFEPQVVKVLEAMPAAALKPADVDIDEVLAERGGGGGDARPSTDGVKKSIYRTTYMFSATMPRAVERLARTYLRRPVVVTIGRAGRATDNVSQRVMVMKENEKPAALLAAVRGGGGGSALSSSPSSSSSSSRTIVFVNTRNASDAVARTLEGAGKRVVVLHGGKSQDAREAGLAAFRAGATDVLVATDVAGRGIDVAGVGLVVNYDMPGTIDAYTHRIGRTGRAGKKGEAVTFLTNKDADVFYDLKKLLEESKAVVPSALASHEASRQPGGGRRGGAESKGNAAILY